jgi:hypothetical protein
LKTKRSKREGRSGKVSEREREREIAFSPSFFLFLSQGGWRSFFSSFSLIVKAAHPA